MTQLSSTYRSKHQFDMPTYDPNALLNRLRDMYGFSSDAKLAQAFLVSQPCLSKIRHKAIPISDEIMVRFHDVTGLSISKLRIMAGIEEPGIPKLNAQ